jgi:hypothetical protein
MVLRTDPAAVSLLTGPLPQPVGSRSVQAVTADASRVVICRRTGPGPGVSRMKQPSSSVSTLVRRPSGAYAVMVPSPAGTTWPIMPPGRISISIETSSVSNTRVRAASGARPAPTD